MAAKELEGTEKKENKLWNPHGWHSPSYTIKLFSTSRVFHWESSNLFFRSYGFWYFRSNGHILGLWFSIYSVLWIWSMDPDMLKLGETSISCMLQRSILLLNIRNCRYLNNNKKLRRIFSNAGPTPTYGKLLQFQELFCCCWPFSSEPWGFGAEREQKRREGWLLYWI